MTLERARELLRKGDVLVVWRLDRLGRTLKHLIELMAELERQGIGFQSVQESIDTTTPGGKLVFHVFGALAGSTHQLRKSLLTKDLRISIRLATNRNLLLLKGLRF